MPARSPAFHSSTVRRTVAPIFGCAPHASLDADPLSPVLLEFMEKPLHLEGWSGTATELLGKLTNRAEDENNCG